MSAMEDVPYELIYAGEVRGIQSLYPTAHEALTNWGIWSRRPRILPRLGRPAIWGMGKEGTADEWGDEKELEEIERQMPDRKRSEMLSEVRADPPDDPEPDEKWAREIDVMVNDLYGFAAVWRVCIKAAYYSNMPEYQMPLCARIKPDHFLLFLSGALKNIEDRLSADCVADERT